MTPTNVGVFVLFYYFALSSCARVPSTFKLCSRSDPDLSSCLAKGMTGAIKTLANGNKQLGIVKLEPLKIKEMNTVTEGRVKMEQKYTNMEMFGLTDSTVESFKIDFDKRTIDIITYSPAIKLLSDYQMKGEMSLVKFDAQGKTEQKLDKFRVHHKLNYDVIDKKGKNYLRVVDYDINYLNFDVQFHFTNLFPSNKELEDNMLNVLKENANSIFEDIKRPYEINMGRLFKHLANMFFEKVPMDEVFLK